MWLGAAAVRLVGLRPMQRDSASSALPFSQQQHPKLIQALRRLLEAMEQAARRLQDKFAILVSRLTADEQHEIRDTIQNADQKFRGWANGLGVCRPENDSRSLSYRLRHSLPLRGRIDDIFEELGLLLEKGMLVAESICVIFRSADCRIPASDLALHGTNGDTPGDPSGLEEDSACVAEDDEYLEDELVSQLKGISTSREALTTWTLRSIDDAITRLFRFSRHIAQITTTDRFAKAQLSQRERIEEHYDRLHVREKFQDSTAPAWLLDRLGTANAQRRQYLYYSREHSQRIECSTAPVSHPTPAVAKSVSPVRQRSFQMPKISPPPTELPCQSEGQTAASTIQTQAPQETQDDFDDVQSCSTVDTSTARDLGPELLTVPPLTAFTSPGHYFDCHYCYMKQRFNGQAGWK